MEVKKHTEVTIIMTEAEASWFKSMLQNLLSEVEGMTDKEMRQSLWDTLHEEGIE